MKTYGWNVVHAEYIEGTQFWLWRRCSKNSERFHYLFGHCDYPPISDGLETETAAREQAAERVRKTEEIDAEYRTAKRKGN